ncbi:MAG: hypothetical protein ACR2L1_02230 [Pyrinomonadaceae bacterium]
MKIETDQPRLPINRLKRPVRQRREDEPQDLLLAGKEGDELENIVKKLYRKKIEI